MKQYTIRLDETVSEFFKEMAITVNRPTEEFLSDVLFKQAEDIKKKIAESFNVEDEE